MGFGCWHFCTGVRKDSTRTKRGRGEAHGHDHKGRAQDSVIKVRAPSSRAHVHWGIEYVVKQAATGEEITKDEWKAMLGELVLKLPAGRSDSDLAFMYGVIDGAHRLWALIACILDPLKTKYTLEYLVPCQVMLKDMPEELIIGIATGESPTPCSSCKYRLKFVIFPCKSPLANLTD